MKRVLNYFVISLSSVILVAGCYQGDLNYVEDRKDGNMSALQEEGAPYPADIEYVDDILALDGLPAFPAGMQVLSVSSAKAFQEAYEGSFGYVVAVRGEPQQIEEYMAGVSPFGPDTAHLSVDRRPEMIPFEEIDVDAIREPSFIPIRTSSYALLEHPLGRAWIVVLQYSP